MKQKKKILHVVESFASGVFTFLVDLINATDNEFDIVIAYGVREETLENFREYFSDRVKFIKVNNFTRSINPKKDIKALLEVKRIVKEEKPDIVHLHSSKAGIIGRLAVNGNKIKMFYNPHGFSFLKKDDSKLKRFIYKTIEKIASLRKCTIVGCSKGEYEAARGLTKNTICINNGININEVDKCIDKNSRKPIDFDNIKICMVGRITYARNPKMFNEIAKLFPNIDFSWIGDGELKNELSNKNINITGWKKRKEVLKILNENDIFILPSLWEGLPISLLEAMYLKKVCIVSNVIGNRDVIKNGKNGFIANDLNDYENIINRIIKKRNVEDIVQNAYNDVLNIYNTQKMAQEYRKNYNS